MDLDMLSKLPDHILESILSRLPSTEEASRTSILSKPWRYLWTSIPSIDIVYDHTRNRKQFKEFVNWVLATRSANLDSFRLHCSRSYRMSTAWQQWIRILVLKRVKLIDLVFCPKDYSIELPHSLVTCTSLEVLRLNLYHHRLTLHFSTRFLRLRVLELNSIRLNDGGLLQHFLYSCPALEELSFINCMLYELGNLSISCPNLNKLTVENRSDHIHIDKGFLDGGVWISCPKLVFLKFAGLIANTFSFQTSLLDSLKKAVINPEDLDHYELSYHPTANSIRTLFPQVSHAQFLSLSHHSIKELDVQAVSLPNLKTLELITTLDADVMDALIKFFICAPHLESLHLIIPKVFLTYKHWNLDDAETRRILAPRLKKVEFLEFKGKRKLVFARSLLKYGDVMEEMVFNWGKCRCDKSIKTTMKKMSKVRKASLNVKIVNLFKD